MHTQKPVTLNSVQGLFLLVVTPNVFRGLILLVVTLNVSPHSLSP
jgi:hypothetical protein